MPSTGAVLGLIAIAGAGFAAVLALLVVQRGTERAVGWSFLPEERSGRPLVRLALASVLGLFLEMLMIRWVSSEIRIFAYFKNFVLIACFLGFGLGCRSCRLRVQPLVTLVALVLLACVVELPRGLVSELPALLAMGSEVQVWGVPLVPPDGVSSARLALGIAVSIPIFALMALAFVPIGQVVGYHLETATNGILAYTVNVLGSLAGIVGYTLLCFLYQPPVVWFALAGALVVPVLAPRSRLRLATVAAFGVACALVALGPEKRETRWSPYQKLRVEHVVENGEIASVVLHTNDSWYQHVIDLSPASVARHPERFRTVPAEWNAYNVPYRICPEPRSVLVLGAGLGNDVAAALRNGAGRVVAVEIDPLILEIGKALHVEKPYDSPKVHQVVDDARSYLENASERFDLVCFSLLDSHVTSSHFTNIRIDNFVYTVEAMKAAKRLLADDGVLIVKFQIGSPWMAGRLYGLLEQAFGYPPFQIQTDSGYTSPGRVFVTGSVPFLSARLGGDAALLTYVKNHAGVASERATLTTDDWPYFYQREPGLPFNVIVISLVLVVLAWGIVRATGARWSGPSWHFFFLGAAFMLLEAQVVSKMALLFGTTWVVSSIVISGLLALVVASNGVVALFPRIPATVGYAGIFASMAVAWCVPVESFFFSSSVLKAAVSTVVLCSPVFFAGIVFVRGFAACGFAGEALGANLLGALVGGLLESLSLWTGLRSLLLLAALLYAASALCVPGRRGERPAA